MFLQTTDGVFLDHHAPHPRSCSSCRRSSFSAVTCAMSCRPPCSRLIEPSFRRAATASEPVVHRIRAADAGRHRNYEARLVRSDNDQILTLVRDVTEARRADMALRESEAMLQASHREIRELAGRLIASQEGERARIGAGAA